MILWPWTGRYQAKQRAEHGANAHTHKTVSVFVGRTMSNRPTRAKKEMHRCQLLLLLLRITDSPRRVSSNHGTGPAERTPHERTYAYADAPARESLLCLKRKQDRKVREKDIRTAHTHLGERIEGLVGLLHRHIGHLLRLALGTLGLPLPLLARILRRGLLRGHRGGRHYYLRLRHSDLCLRLFRRRIVTGGAGFASGAPRFKKKHKPTKIEACVACHGSWREGAPEPGIATRLEGDTSRGRCMAGRARLEAKGKRGG